MRKVEEYYKLQRITAGEVDKKRIYLATDDPRLFNEVRLKQVKNERYEFWIKIVRLYNSLFGIFVLDILIMKWSVIVSRP